MNFEQVAKLKIYAWNVLTESSFPYIILCQIIRCAANSDDIKGRPFLAFPTGTFLALCHKQQPLPKKSQEGL